jgi:hypothetical protein
VSLCFPGRPVSPIAVRSAFDNNPIPCATRNTFLLQRDVTRSETSSDILRFESPVNIGMSLEIKLEVSAKLAKPQQVHISN